MGDLYCANYHEYRRYKTCKSDALALRICICESRQGICSCVGARSSSWAASQDNSSLPVLENDVYVQRLGTCAKHNPLLGEPIYHPES